MMPSIKLAQQDEAARAATAEAGFLAQCEAAHVADDIPEGLSVLRLILDRIQVAGRTVPAPGSVGEDCSDLADMAVWVLTRIDGEVADLRKAAKAAGWMQ